MEQFLETLSPLIRSDDFKIVKKKLRKKQNNLKPDTTRFAAFIARTIEKYCNKIEKRSKWVTTQELFKFMDAPKRAYTVMLKNNGEPVPGPSNAMPVESAIGPERAKKVAKLEKQLVVNHVMLLFI